MCNIKSPLKLNIFLKKNYLNTVNDIKLKNKHFELSEKPTIENDALLI